MTEGHITDILLENYKSESEKETTVQIRGKEESLYGTKTVK